MAAVIATQKKYSLLENMDINLSGLRYDNRNNTKQSEDIFNTEIYNDDHHNSVNIDYQERMGDIEDKKFWMNLVPPSKLELDYVESLKSRFKIVELFLAFGSFCVLLVCQFEYELEYYPNKYECNPKIDVCNYKGLPVRVIVSFVSVMLACLSIYAAILGYKIKREQKKLITVSFWGSSYFYNMLIDVTIDLIHPIPGVEKELELVLLGQQIKYQLMTFLYALMFLKLYSSIRIAAAYTSYSSRTSEKICEMYGTEASTTFQLKAIQKDHPFFIVSLSFASICVILGILIRMFEVLDISGGGVDNYQFYTNGIWNIIVTMTTVGYGDFFPKTHVGRIISVLSIILGTLLVSLSIVSINRAIEFNTKERQAFIILNRTVLRKKLNETCQRIIKLNWDLCMIKEDHCWKYKKILSDTRYTAIIREIRELSIVKKNLKRDLSKDTFFKQEEKFIALNDRIGSEISQVKSTLFTITDFRNKIRAQLKLQKNVMDNLDSNIKIMKENIKPAFYNLVGKNPQLLSPEKIPRQHMDNFGIDFGSKENVAELIDLETEKILFNDDKNLKAGIFGTLLMKKIDKNLVNAKSKYLQEAEETEHSYASMENHKDPVLIELERHQGLDEKTKKIFESSNKTMNLLQSLSSMNAKNREVFSRFKKSQTSALEDDLMNFEPDSSAFNANDVNINQNMLKGERPILDRLASKNHLEEKKDDRRSHLEQNSNLDLMSRLNLNTNNNRKDDASIRAYEDYNNIQPTNQDFK